MKIVGELLMVGELVIVAKSIFFSDMITDLTHHVSAARGMENPHKYGY